MKQKNSNFIHNLDISPGGEKNLPRKILIYSVIALSIVVLITFVYLFMRSLGNEEETFVGNGGLGSLGAGDYQGTTPIGGSNQSDDETLDEDGNGGSSGDNPGEGLFEFFEYSS